jgi:DNA-binding LacI/PurR family transcriptional regulator
MAVMSQLLETNFDDVVDAVAAMSDELALGVLRAADQAGITVPDQMAVTRWDDADADAPAGLTTVHQDLRVQGADCARIALDHPSSPDPPCGETIIRRSLRPQDRSDGA